VPSKLPFPTSLPDFMRLFPDDVACAAYLEKFEGQVLKFEEQRDRLLAREAQREASSVS
jgi:hypothetical protein